MDKPMTKDAKVNKLKQLRDNKVKSNKKDFDVVNDSMLKDAFIDLKNKMPGAPRIVLLAGFNEAARPDLIKYQSYISSVYLIFALQGSSCPNSRWFSRRSHQYQH